MGRFVLMLCSSYISIFRDRGMVKPWLPDSPIPMLALWCGRTLENSSAILAPERACLRSRFPSLGSKRGAQSGSRVSVSM